MNKAPATSAAADRRLRFRRAVPVVVLAAAVGGAFADAAPTGLDAADVVLRAAFAGAVSAAASVSRRWTWFVLCGLAAAAPSDPAWRLMALVALGLTVASAWTHRRGRLTGAVVGALAAQTLLRLDPFWFHGLTALITTAATAPVFVVGYRYSSSLTRRLLRRTAVVVGGVALVATLLFAVGMVRGRAAAERGLGAARQGLVAAELGDTATAAERFGVATSSFDRADQSFSAWWMAPARAVPVVGQHLVALQTAASEGGSLARTASEAARTADVEQLALRGGELDLELVQSMADPLAASALTLGQARDALVDVSSPWLVQPLGDRLDALVDEIDTNLPHVQLAADAARVLPPLLGADGERRYLVLFATPAEARELGGILGNYAEISAVDGRLTLEAFGRNSDLNAQSTDGLSEPDSFPSRFRRMQPWRFSQNYPGMPDLPSVARAVADLYPRMGGEPVDGVMYADPFAVEALLELTGPVAIDGVPMRLDSANTAEFLLTGQYETLGSQAERVDMLAEASEAALRRLFEIDLPGPRRLGELFGPLVRAGRLQFVPFADAAEDFTAELGLDGAIPDVDDGDFFAVVHANAAANKLDAYLQRDVTYDATVDPATGELQATATITLQNQAPSGLPAYVVGDPPSGPEGTMQVQLSLYTPHRLAGLQVDGSPVGGESQWEFDRWRYLVQVTVPPAEARTVTFDVEGAVLPGPQYHLVVANQPLVHDDEVTVTLRRALPSATSPSAADDLTGGEGTGEVGGEDAGGEGGEDRARDRADPLAEWQFEQVEDVELLVDWPG